MQRVRSNSELTPYEQDQLNKRELITRHQQDLDIDELIPLDGPIKVPLQDYPPLLPAFPVTQCKTEIQNVITIQDSKQVISFEEWKHIME